MEQAKLTFLKKTARIAGFWYLIMLIVSPIGLIYIPSKIIVNGNATETVKNILISESIFKIGIIAILLGKSVLYF